MTNALLSDWTSEFEMPPFAEITDEDFGSAFDTALLEARGKIAKIAENPEALSHPWSNRSRQSHRQTPT